MKNKIEMAVALALLTTGLVTAVASTQTQQADAQLTQGDCDLSDGSGDCKGGSGARTVTETRTSQGGLGGHSVCDGSECTVSGGSGGRVDIIGGETFTGGSGFRCQGNFDNPEEISCVGRH